MCGMYDDIHAEPLLTQTDPLNKLVTLFCCLTGELISGELISVDDYEVLMYFVFMVVSDEVHSLFSSLMITNRNYACIGEVVTFLCEGTGTRLVWVINGNRIIFFSDDRVDTVRVTQRQSIRAILLYNDPPLEGEGMRHFTSVLLLSVDSSMNSINVTCSTNVDTKSLFHGVAGT